MRASLPVGAAHSAGLALGCGNDPVQRRTGPRALDERFEQLVPAVAIGPCLERGDSPSASVDEPLEVERLELESRSEGGESRAAGAINRQELPVTRILEEGIGREQGPCPA